MRVSRLEPTREQLEVLARRPADEPVVMVNLLTFHVDGGRERYLQYAREVVPHIERVGATVKYAGASPTTVIGHGERPGWDAILVVEYPSPAAFLDMIAGPGYADVHAHRSAALEYGDLVATSVWSLAD